jgi:hypothetical protein
MFSALRVLVVIGVIFYFSPARHGNEPPVRMDDLVRWSQDRIGQDRNGQDRIGQDSGSNAGPVAQAGHLQSLWQALPDSAKKAVVEEVVGIGSDAAASHSAQPADQPHVAELQPAARGEAKKRP